MSNAVIVAVVLVIFGVLWSPLCVSGAWIATQSSTLNTNTAGLAIDSSQLTCAISGAETGPWLKIDLGVDTTINGVQILGNLSATSIRVGDQTNPYALQAGFSANPLCVTVMSVSPSSGPVKIPCRHSVVGRYITFEVVVNDVEQLKICDIQLF